MNVIALINRDHGQGDLGIKSKSEIIKREKELNINIYKNNLYNYLHVQELRFFILHFIYCFLFFFFYLVSYLFFIFF